MKSKFLLSCFLLISATFSAYSQTNLWQDVPVENIAAYVNSQKQLLPEKFRVVKLNSALASQLQSKATQESLQQFSNTSSFDIPKPDGNSLQTYLFESFILSPELRQIHPQIKTYLLINQESKNISARLTISTQGVSGILFTDNGTAYIYPLGDDYPGLHIVYYIKDLKTISPLQCGVKQDISSMQPSAPTAGDCQRRTYRLAVATTGEYTVWAGSQANALTSLTTTVNDVTAIYERDVTIRFTIVTNNSILFPDATIDPYPTLTSPNGALLTTNHSTIDANIGSPNYDLGIVFNRGWNGGLAGLSVTCNNSFKGRSSAGLDFGIGANPTPGPQGPVFAGTVAHEIAHQFSATHSFAGNNSGCAGNNTAATAYEPGGGSTIMAYAGICAPNSYQNNSDLYFHAGNIAQIQTYATGVNGACATPVAITNTAPLVTVPATSYTIPISTPFTLNSTGTDANGNILKYTWEQMDAGFVTSSPPLPTNTSGPNFRSYAPSTNSSRTFPRIEDIIANISPAYEVLPSITRTMNFRVTVRDEAIGGGCTAEANVAVNTNSGAGPFVVSSQNTSTNWVANGSNTASITWNVANTNNAPVNCSAVDILFSIDGGLTYPYTLVSNSANDGTETITIPNLVTLSGRIKISARNNIFFDINDADITITSGCAAEGATFAPGNNITGAAGSPTLDLTLNPQYGTILVPSGQIANTDPSSTLSVINITPGSCITFGNTYFYDTYRFTVNTSGSYTFTLSGGAPSGLIINLYNNSFDPANTCNDFITSNGTYNGTSVSISNNFSASLLPGRFYTLAVGSFSNTTPALPANYTISVTGPGNIYNNTPNPGAAFNYTFVIVDNATGNIKAIDPSANLSSATTFPVGTYIVYGLSYANSIPLATLNAYIGGAFTTLSNDLLFNPATRCGNLSKNLIIATVTASLPVQFLPLKAYKINKEVLLKWGTANEQNSSHFEIERSVDGLNFNKTIGRINAIGFSNTISDYSITDQTPALSRNYYRIKQVDLDGKAEYSNVVSINMSDKFLEIITYPNPASSILSVDYFTDNKSAIRFSIIDAKGALVKEMNISTQTGRNIIRFDISNLSKGIYLLKVANNKETVVSKFIKD